MLKNDTHNKTSTADYSSSINLLNQYKEILDESAIVSKTDAKGVIIYVNDTFCEISGYKREELLGKTHNIIRDLNNHSHIYKNMWNTIKDKKIWKGTIKNIAKTGKAYYVKSVIMPILNDTKEIVEYIAARTDVTELVEKENIIKHQYKDKLTRLRNREALIHDLSLVDDYSVLLLINIDRFSDINSYFGYDVGDSLLKQFSRNINTEESSSLYRISGDEFAVLCPKKELNEELRFDIHKLIANLESKKFLIKSNEISTLVSCGVAYAKNDVVYKLSHIAIKESKISNKKVVFYNDEKSLHNKTKENIEIIHTIKHALEEDRFIPYYQGIVDNKTKKIVKYEALIRLKNEDGSIVSPYFFLEHSKKAKLYDKLTQIMIIKAFQKFSNLNYKFSINLCIQDIESDATKKVLVDNLIAHKCGDRVVLEIVESEGIENFDELIVFIKEIKKFGCQIAIDDFGTGYSNFSYLSKLNVDYIKIDGSLIENIDTDITQRITVESILHFAKSLNIQTIAEFVETQSIYEVLVELGVDFSQGYLFSKPSEDL